MTTSYCIQHHLININPDWQGNSDNKIIITKNVAWRPSLNHKIMKMSYKKLLQL